MYRVSDKINKRLSMRLKRAIRSLQLIDTGSLYSSINIRVYVSDLGQITMEIEAMYYIVYLWEKHGIEFVFFGRGFQDYVSEILQEWADYMVRKDRNLRGFQEVLRRIDGFVNIEFVQLYIE